MGGLFANDDGLAAQLLAAGEATGDKLWRMPMGEAYDKLIDSPIADMKNVGPREGGSITAAQFIARFIKPGVKWAHLDIAGMVWAAKDGPLWAKGATGYGVRLLERFVADELRGVTSARMCEGGRRGTDVNFYQLAVAPARRRPAAPARKGGGRRISQRRPLGRCGAARPARRGVVDVRRGVVPAARGRRTVRRRPAGAADDCCRATPTPPT